jgi:hypothetical protein
MIKNLVWSHQQGFYFIAVTLHLAAFDVRNKTKTSGNRYQMTTALG